MIEKNIANAGKRFLSSARASNQEYPYSLAVTQASTLF